MLSQTFGNQIPRYTALYPRKTDTSATPLGKLNKTGTTCTKNTEARSRNHFCHEKAISITHSECVPLALVIQHAKRMRRIIATRGLCGSNRFLHAIINGTIFWIEVIKHTICVLIFSTTSSETFLIRRKIQRDIIINIHRSSYKVPVIFINF
jgi:hypothetical protein